MNSNVCYNSTTWINANIWHFIGHVLTHKYTMMNDDDYDDDNIDVVVWICHALDCGAYTIYIRIEWLEPLRNPNYPHPYRNIWPFNDTVHWSVGNSFWEYHKYVHCTDVSIEKNSIRTFKRNKTCTETLTNVPFRCH